MIQIKGEILKGLKIILVLFFLSFLAPDVTIDPWGLFIPQKILFLITLIACIQYFGFILNFLLGPKVGMILTGFLGGLISSTAVYTHLGAEIKKKPFLYKEAISCGLSSIVANNFLVMLILYSSAHDLFHSLIIPTVTMMVVAITLILMLHMKSERVKMQTISDTEPLKIASVLKLAAIVFLMLTLTTVTKKIVSEEALLPLSFLTGLFEIHGITLAQALLYSQKAISFDVAVQSIGVAIIASFFSKLIITWALDTSKYAVFTTVAHLVILTSGTMVFLLF